MSNREEILLDVQGLSMSYRWGSQYCKAVREVSFTLHRGEILGVAGESRSGKSSLGQGLLGLFLEPLMYEEGAVILDDRDLMGLSKEELRKNILGQKISYIPEKSLEALNPSCRVGKFAQNLMTVHAPELDRYAVEALFAERLEELDLSEEVATKYPVELSSREQQRVVLALATLTNPLVLIVDDPTSSLDVSAQKVLLKLLKKFLAKGYCKSMLFLTHELPLLYHIADTIAVMHEGKIVELGDAEMIITVPKHPYTQLLMKDTLQFDLLKGSYV